MGSVYGKIEKLRFGKQGVSGGAGGYRGYSGGVLGSSFSLGRLSGTFIPALRSGTPVPSYSLPRRGIAIGTAQRDGDAFMYIAPKLRAYARLALFVPRFCLASFFVLDLLLPAVGGAWWGGGFDPVLDPLPCLVLALCLPLARGSSCITAYMAGRLPSPLALYL